MIPMWSLTKVGLKHLRTFGQKKEGLLDSDVLVEKGWKFGRFSSSKFWNVVKNILVSNFWYCFIVTDDDPWNWIESS